MLKPGINRGLFGHIVYIVSYSIVCPNHEQKLFFLWGGFGMAVFTSLGLFIESTEEM